MSTKVDDRIVSMRFNNSQFQKGASESISALQKLKDSLNLKGAAAGLNELNAAGKSFSLAGLADGVQGILSKFGTLSVVGITALANIANRAVDAGLTMARSLTIDPIKSGLDEYELKMGSIQTILANTARYGTSLDQVTASLDELNEYADKTIYNFGDMTKNIGLFTNAGIKVEDATAMIKGFSNEAAASGTSAMGAAGAAYQLSQALSAGTIRLMDWRSLTNVGMGNKNMQNGLIEIANAMGTLEANTITAEEVQADFNGSLEKNWLSADVMSTYLRIMAGEMDAASMSALGLSDAQIQAFQQQAATAEEAATKVRTWTQLVGTLQEGVGSSWAQTFDILIGDFNEATELWTAVSDTLGAMIGAAGDARNQLLQEWKDLGGRDSAINAVTNAFQALMAIMKPIKDAFVDIFPPVTAQNLVDITKGIENFTKSLMPSEATLDRIGRTAKGFFAVLDIGWMVLKQVVGLFGRLLGAVSPVGAGFLDVTANVGDFLVKIRDAIKNGDGLAKVFKIIGDVLEKPIELLRKIGEYTANVFTVEGFAQAWEAVGKALQKVGEFLKPVADWFVTAFKTVKKAVTDAFKSMDFNVLLGMLNAGLLGGIFVIIKKFIDKIPDMLGGIGGGIFDTIKGAFGELTNTLQTMQMKLKADVLIKIAIAIGLLTAAVVALSMIDTGKLFVSIGAMGLLFAELMTAMIIMEKATASKGFAKMPFLAASMIGMATAMVILAGAVAILGHLDWEELAKGISSLAVGLGLLVGGTVALSKFSGKMLGSAPGLVLMATAIVIFAGAMKIMGSMEWDEIARGMTVLAGGLTLMVGAMLLVQKGSVGAGAMVLISIALNVLAGALGNFSKLSWDEIGRSLTTLAGSLAILVVAMQFMQNSVVGAGAMVIVALAINVLANAFKSFAEMSWDDIGRSLVVLAGGLAILAAAMALMGIPLVLLGSVGITLASAAMMMLAPALKILGTMSWDDIGRGLTMLGASLVIIAAGGMLLIPAIPGLMALGTVAVMIGVAALAAGAGMVMMAAGLTALAAAAAVGSEAIKTAIMTLIDLIPQAMASFAQGIIEFAKVIAGGGVEFTAAMTTLLQSLIDSINTMAPQIIDTLSMLLNKLIDKMTEDIPRFVDRGMKLIEGILEGISNRLPGIMDKATDVIVAFIDGINRNLPRVIQAGMNLIIDFVNGLANEIRSSSGRLRDAGWNLAEAIIDGMTGGLWSGVGAVIDAAAGVAQDALNAALSALGINSPSKRFWEVGEYSTQGLALGLTQTAANATRAATGVGVKTVGALQKSISGIANAVRTDINLTPTIRPVLDLSAVKKESTLIGGLLTPPQLAVDGTYASAVSAANSQRAIRETESASREVQPTVVENTTFNQYNNSPKPLNSGDIYRQTKNVISVAKKGTVVTDA